MNLLVLSSNLMVIASLLAQFIYVKKRNNLFAVDTFFICCFTLFYSFDLLYSLSQFREGGYFLSGRFFPWHDHSLLVSAAVVSIVPWIWISGFWFISIFSKGEFSFYSGKNFKKKKIITSFVFYVGLSAVSFLLVFQKLASTVGIKGYLLDMAQRSLIFEDFTLQNAFVNFVLVAATPVSAIAIFQKDYLSKVVGFVLLFFIGSSALLSGARAPLVQMLFTILVVRHFYFSRINLNFKLVTFAFVFLVILVQIALSTRTVSVVHDNVIDNVFSTGQVPQSNNLHAMYATDLSGELGGESIVNDLLSPIPSFVFSALGKEKQMGGNTYYTREFWPERWINTRSQISLGGVNELIYNFGTFLALLAIFIISILYSICEKIMYRSFYGPIFMTGLLWSIFQQLRGDYFHTINKLAIFIVSYILLLVFLKGVRFREL